MTAAHYRMLFAGLLAIATLSCSADLVREGATRVDSLSTTHPSVLLTSGPAGGHVDYCYWSDDPCILFVHPAEGSPYRFDALPPPQGLNFQLEPMTFVFPKGATNLIARLQGSLPCAGSHGTVSAFDATGAQLGDYPMEIDDPSDCGEDELTGRVSVFINAPRPVAKVVISAPSPLSYPLPELFRIHNGLPPGIIVYGEAQPNFSFDWSAAPPAQVPSLVESDSLVGPVLTQVFDAVIGSARNSTRAGAPEQHRADTLSITVQVDTARGPAPLDTFWLETGVQPGSGYHFHDHATRPKGRLWPAPEAAAAAVGPGGDSLLPVLLPTNGKLRVVYRSSGVSGIEIVRLRSGSATGPVIDSVQIRVAVTGLVRMTRDVAGLYYFKDQDSTIAGQGHGDFNDGVTQAFRDSVQRAFHKYLDGENDFLRGETRFVITEASLPWGGLLDIASPANEAWRWPHFTHRTGTDMDVRTHLPGSEPDALREVMDIDRRVAFLKACDSVVDCHFETPDDVHPRPYHFHLKPRRGAQ